MESANHTSGPFDSDVDEMELSGLTPVASEMVPTYFSLCSFASRPLVGDDSDMCIYIFLAMTHL